MTTSSEHLGSNQSSHAAFLHSDFLLFFVCSKQLHPISRAPDNRPFCTLRLGKPLTHNQTWSVATWSPGKDNCIQNTVLHDQGHCQSSEIKRMSILLQCKDREPKKRKIQHESHVTKWLLDAWKDSIPSESHARNCHSNPGANPTALHPRWVGPLLD